MKWIVLIGLCLVLSVHSDPFPPIANGDVDQEHPDIIEEPISEAIIDDSATESTEKPEEPEEPPEEPEEPENSGNDRTKRFVNNNEQIWPNNEVFYYFDPIAYPTPASEFETRFGMKYMEERTCNKYTQVDPSTFTGTKVKFVKTHGCHAYQGAQPHWSQTAQCCSGSVCIHELLHLFGIVHEHQNPNRNNYVRINWNNILNGKWSQFTRKSATSISEAFPGTFAISSTIHYVPWSFRNSYGYSITVLNSDVKTGTSFYYPLREVNKIYDCQQVACSNFTDVCEEDGYVTTYRGKCQCICPEGLDPAERCTKPISSRAVYEWPSGSYAFVAAGVGCPVGFDIGHRKHWSDGWSWKIGGTNPMKGVQDTKSTEYEFCVSSNKFPNSENTWPAGKYCLFRVDGSCPAGFTDGWIQYDDEIKSAATNNTMSGTLPDGVYGEDTRFEVCCRNDGYPDVEMELPTDNEFVLYLKSQKCPKVKNMNSFRFFYTFDNHDAGGLASFGGSTPKIYKYGVTWGMYICQYVPLTVSCGGVITLSDTDRTGSFNSPNYPSKYADNTKCTWLIKAPENSKILLDFEHSSFSLGSDDTVEVRLFNIGENGIKFSNFNGRTYKSYKNRMLVTFSSSTVGVETGFSAAVKYVTDEENCYSELDAGASYRGTVSYTRKFDRCLPWNEVKHCRFSSLHPKYSDAGLDSNYCRNPGTGDRPWCYTEATECARDSCDVCSYEKIFDRFDDCPTLNATIPNFCTSDDRGFTYCRSYCSQHYPVPLTPPAVLAISCSTPDSPPSDGTTNDPLTGPYAVGKQITYTCTARPASSETITCTTEGTWTESISACKVCDNGWMAFNNKCYYEAASTSTWTGARDSCIAMGAVLIMPKTNAERDFFHRVRAVTRVYWVGANDLATEGTFKWMDGSLVAEESKEFLSPQPSTYSSSYDCVALNSEENPTIKWRTTYCSKYSKYAYICEKKYESTCHDLLTNCAQKFAMFPSFCDVDNSFAALKCAETCGLCNHGNFQSYNPPAAGTNYYRVSSTTVYSGEKAEYKCNTGTTLESGNLLRACLSNGTFSGSPPSCIDDASANILTFNNQEPLMVRRQTLSNFKHRIYTGDGYQFQISRAGEIVRWDYTSSKAGPVGLMVLRPFGTDSTLINYNLFNTDGKKRPSYFYVPIGERIHVEAGDRIGIWFPGSKQTIDVSIHSSAMRKYFPEEKVRRSKLTFENSTALTLGASYEIYISSSETFNGIFSVRAVIGPRST